MATSAHRPDRAGVCPAPGSSTGVWTGACLCCRGLAVADRRPRRCSCHGLAHAGLGTRQDPLPWGLVGPQGCVSSEAESVSTPHCTPPPSRGPWPLSGPAPPVKPEPLCSPRAGGWARRGDGVADATWSEGSVLPRRVGTAAWETVPRATVTPPPERPHGEKRGDLRFAQRPSEPPAPRGPRRRAWVTA